VKDSEWDSGRRGRESRISEGGEGAVSSRYMG
jgi:hypothetical protein